jgi:hypothetical protein
LQLGKHWRLEPVLLVVGKLVVRSDLGGSGPTADLFERKRTENAAVLVLAQKPGLAGDSIPSLVRLGRARRR